MKKTLVIVALATLMVFAFSGVAMAKITNNYHEWDAAGGFGGANATVPTPHKGYTEATVKCNVCHAVHNAPIAGTGWDANKDGDFLDAGEWEAGDTDTEMLLRSTVANACNYCHIETSIGGTQLYGGDPVLYTRTGNPWEDFNHGGPSASCTGCHAVHGANTYGGPTTLANKILKQGTIQDEVILEGVPAVDPLNDALFPSAADAYAGTNVRADAAGDLRNAQLTAFCSQCHSNYSYASEQTVNVDGDYVYGDSGYVYPTGSSYRYKTHPLKAAATGAVGDRFVAAGATITSDTPVAFATSATCRDCHDAGNVDEGAVTTYNSFPHYTRGSFNFMTAGASVGDAQDHGDPLDATDPPYMFQVDGHCLKCHVNAAGTAGINITY
ncbi:MAG: hypothetical protein QMC79_08695 [Anaerosomatales bacterium]|nr:hypothetical protein [Anaerosomatales bacterium]